MDYLIYITERCNLACTYCESLCDRAAFAQDVSYDTKTLIKFLNKDPDVNLQFYGGEPLLKIELMREIMDNVPFKRASIQTNGVLLDKLDKDILDRIDVISISLDGPEDVTDEKRGKGVYKKSIEQALKLDYDGMLNVRMTISPGLDIERCVLHFLDDCEVKFNNVHWQLNVLFHKDDWKNKDMIRDWFVNDYNPGITRLVKKWMQEMMYNKKILNIVPFNGIMHSLLTESPVKNIRCGAGWFMWAIDTEGKIFPCPVMRENPDYCKGHIDSINPLELKGDNGEYELSKCNECDVFEICGGRCLYASKKKLWDEEGYDLVCDSVKHLVRKMLQVYPMVKRLVDSGKICIDDFDAAQDYEVIP